MLLHTVPLLLALVQAPDTTTPAGARNPAWAPDGRLALSVRGDLWVQSAPGVGARWVRVTSGLAWDREPAWTSDGAAIVFSSDRGGNFDLWRVRVGASGSATGAPEQLTDGT